MIKGTIFVLPVMNSFISIIIPCYNEANFLAPCLDSVIADDYPKDRMELLIVDGKSTDCTLTVAKDYGKRYPYISILNNEKRYFPSAVNLGIKSCKGDIIVILGAHAVYSKNYISKCVDYLSRLSADNVGGILKTVPQNPTFTGGVISAVLSSRFGVGNSTFRTGSDKPVEVDTVFGGCYRKELFAEIGYFNEELTSSSDIDFNKRVRKAEGRIFLVPDIIATYYTRSAFLNFVKNNFRNGFWSIYPLIIVKYLPVSLRHLVPFCFTSSLIGSFILSLWMPFFIKILIGIILTYTSANLYFSLSVAMKKKSVYFFVLPFFYFILHFAYGLGSIGALIKIVFTILNKKLLWIQRHYLSN